MIRKQLYITSDIDRALDIESKRQGKSQSEVIRQIFRKELGLNKKAKNPSGALLRIAENSFSEGPGDLSTNLFSYLYGEKSPNYGKKKVSNTRRIKRSFKKIDNVKYKQIVR